MVKYRLAKISDAKFLTKVHLICAKNQIGGFFHNLGFYFTFNYYKILLSNKNSIILVAEDQHQNILGFHSGTLKMEEQLIDLKKNKIILAFSLIPQLLMNPKLIYGVINRYFSISNTNSNKNDFGVKKGARLEYWCWLPSNPNPIGAIGLHYKWLKLIKSHGVKNVCFEADSVNKKILNFHKKNGAEILKELDLIDGRKRYVLQYKLN